MPLLAGSRLQSAAWTDASSGCVWRASPPAVVVVARVTSQPRPGLSSAGRARRSHAIVIAAQLRHCWLAATIGRRQGRARAGFNTSSGLRVRACVASAPLRRRARLKPVVRVARVRSQPRPVAQLGWRAAAPSRATLLGVRLHSRPESAAGEGARGPNRHAPAQARPGLPQAAGGLPPGAAPCTSSAGCGRAAAPRAATRGRGRGAGGGGGSWDQRAGTQAHERATPGRARDHERAHAGAGQGRRRRVAGTGIRHFFALAGARAWRWSGRSLLGPAARFCALQNGFSRG